MSAATADPAPLTDDLLTMDVADALRRDPALAAASESDRAAALRAYYRSFGLEISDEVIAGGIAASRDDRYRHVATTRGLGAALARLYISRRNWAPPTIAILVALAVVFGGYFLAYQPYRLVQLQQAQVELTQTMPATMDGLFHTIHEETKVTQAESNAAAAVDRGKAAVAKGDRAGAQQAIADLTAIRDALRAEYQLRIADQPGGKWGFWTFPKSNAEETNYYLVVQAIGDDGTALTLPVRSEETGRTDQVSVWAERVPEDVYRAVEADKADDGVIQHALLGVKEFGFLTPSYVVPTLGGQLTRW